MAVINNRLLSFLFRLCGTVFGIWGCYIALTVQSESFPGSKKLFYTVQTNIFSSAVFLLNTICTLFGLLKKGIKGSTTCFPRLHAFFTVGITLTFIVFWVILYPTMKNFDAFSAENILGMSSANKGTFFVEDRVAADFLAVCLEDCAPILLREYTIDIVGGEAEISNRLKFPHSEKIKYNFVGIYDGDMRNKLDKTGLFWKYCFLPGEKPLEMLFQHFAEQQAGMEWLSSFLNVSQSTIFAYIGSLTGTDYHDWFEELRKLLGTDGKALVRAFYAGMKGTFFDTDAFLTELKQCLEPA